MMKVTSAFVVLAVANFLLVEVAAHPSKKNLKILDDQDNIDDTQTRHNNMDEKKLNGRRNDVPSSCGYEV